MTRKMTKIGERYKSKINTVAINCSYEVIKKFKTVCWVKLWEKNKSTSIIYKNVRYSILCPLQNK